MPSRVEGNIKQNFANRNHPGWFKDFMTELLSYKRRNFFLRKAKVVLPHPLLRC